MIIHVLAKFKNETKIKTSLRASGLRSLRILRIERIDSAANKRVFNPPECNFYQGTPLETRLGLVWASFE